jgi:transcription elongation GreA/GreB family factor
MPIRRAHSVPAAANCSKDIKSVVRHRFWPDKRVWNLQFHRMQKAVLLKAVLAELENELRMLTEAANTARDEATNEESRAEDRFDMRSQSAAYLAAGQAKMAGETADAITAYRSLPTKTFTEADPIATGALVVLQSGARKSYYFLGPQRGGLEVTVEDKTVIVVTAASPLGHQLLGRKVGDVVTLPGRPKPVEHTVIRVE